MGAQPLHTRSSLSTLPHLPLFTWLPQANQFTSQQKHRNFASMALTGGLLRMVMIGCYVLAFCCATIITGAFGWFTARRNFTTRNIASVSIGSITMVYTLVCILVYCTPQFHYSQHSLCIYWIYHDGIYTSLHLGHLLHSRNLVLCTHQHRHGRHLHRTHDRRCCHQPPCSLRL